LEADGERNLKFELVTSPDEVDSLVLAWILSPWERIGPDPRVDESAVNGAYRFEVTDEVLREVGVLSTDEITENRGVITYTLKDGQWCSERTEPRPLQNPVRCATYDVFGDWLVLNYSPTGREIYRWRKAASGDLQLTVLGSAPVSGQRIADAYTANAWVRLDDAQ
jgi:hypothetical protein